MMASVYAEEVPTLYDEEPTPELISADTVYDSIKVAVTPLIGKEVPMYGNEVINVYLEDGTVIGNAVTANKIFESMVCVSLFYRVRLCRHHY